MGGEGQDACARGSILYIDLPYPPSVWDMYVGWGKQRRLSPEYDKWRTDAGHFIRAKRRMLDVPFVAHIALKRPNKRQDLDNRAKACLDVLQHYGVIKNDNLCERLTLQWDSSMDAECRVIICVAEEALAA